MLKWALIFAVVAVIAGDIAKFLFFLFLAVVAFFVVAGVFLGKKVSGG